MSCDIVIRSYWRDLPWLRYCLAATDRFCRGFRQTIVVTPRASQPWLARSALARSHPSTRFVPCRDYLDDYLGQQVTKLYADQVTDAELICHVDSDCIFEALTTPDALAPAGRPRIYTRPLSALPRDWPWTEPTAEFLGVRPSHDFMQCPPFTFPRWLYSELRDFCRERHGVELEQWVISRNPRGFSEFNALAAYAHDRHPEAFCWVRMADRGEEESTCRWYSSWDGLDAGTRSDLDALLGEDLS